MKKILEYIVYPFIFLYWLIYAILFETRYGLVILIVGSMGLFTWYGITYQPGRYCKYCGEAVEYRSTMIYRHPCKNSSSGKHNIEFYWEKPANGHTSADELNKYIE